MSEKEHNDVHKQQITFMVTESETKKMIVEKIIKENETLIERVAQAESNIDNNREEIAILTKKKNDYKMMVEQLKDKNKSIEEVLTHSEESKVTEVKEMEKRIESRVAKIIQQKDN